MLGRFLEYSIPTPDIRASLDFYVKLGFSPADVGDTWAHPYAVLTDGRVHIGLHQLDTQVPALTFVKPDVLRQIDELESRGIVLEYRNLGNDVFNEVGWLDPSGHLVRLVEARTFSPVKQARGSLCEYFAEIALPAPDRELAKQWWEQLGFVGLDEPDAPLPHVSCTSDSIDIGLYDPAELRVPTLMFEVDDIARCLARLADAGVAPSGPVPAPLRQRAAAMLRAPEGTPLLLAAP